MKRLSITTCSLLLAAVLSVQAEARAEASGPDFFKVVGVPSGDVLNIRAGASAGHARIGRIPATADGIRNLGCIGGLSFADWQKASEEERAAGARTRWCKIEYAGVEGWVAGWYLGEGSAPAAAAETTAPRPWRIVEVGGFPTEGEPEIGFRAEGGFYGSTGCNQFQGQAILEGHRLVVQGPMATTRMACPGGRLDAQERDVLAILESGPRIEFDPFGDEMIVIGAGDRASMRLERAR